MSITALILYHTILYPAVLTYDRDPIFGKDEKYKVFFLWRTKGRALKSVYWQLLFGEMQWLGRRVAFHTYFDVPYINCTAISSKRLRNRRGIVPLNVSNICNQYSPDFWQNSNPIRKLTAHTTPDEKRLPFWISGPLTFKYYKNMAGVRESVMNLGFHKF